MSLCFRHILILPGGAALDETQGSFQLWRSRRSLTVRRISSSLQREGPLGPWKPKEQVGETEGQEPSLTRNAAPQPCIFPLRGWSQWKEMGPCFLQKKDRSPMCNIQSISGCACRLGRIPGWPQDSHPLMYSPHAAPSPPVRKELWIAWEGLPKIRLLGQ